MVPDGVGSRSRQLPESPWQSDDFDGFPWFLQHFFSCPLSSHRKLWKHYETTQTAKNRSFITITRARQIRRNCLHTLGIKECSWLSLDNLAHRWNKNRLSNNLVRIRREGQAQFLLKKSSLDCQHRSLPGPSRSNFRTDLFRIPPPIGDLWINQPTKNSIRLDVDVLW